MPLEPLQSVSQADKDKAQLLTILSSMSEGVVAMDESQRILLVNEAAGQLLGFARMDVIGRPLFEVVRIEPILKAVSQSILTGEKKQSRVGPINGRHLDVTVCKLPRLELRAGLILVAHDITESVRYDELRREFVANVSHELRTPLTMINGFVETLLHGAIGDTTKAREYLQIVAKHSQQLTNLVNDLLDLSRLESMPTQRGTDRVSVLAMLHRVTEMLSPAANQKNHSLKVGSIERDLPAVVGTAADLERAVTNLIDNAIKYTPPGGTISLSARRDGEDIQIDVSDNGIGIPPEDQYRIFERFYRVDRSRSRDMGGTGLGLSIVKHVIQAHGGSVDVTSTPGEGSTFHIRLPACKS